MNEYLKGKKRNKLTIDFAERLRPSADVKYFFTAPPIK
jgi:hypothetical protein